MKGREGKVKETIPPKKLVDIFKQEAYCQMKYKEVRDMGRIRTIKPEFWTDPNVMACSFEARLLYIGIWNFADDQGNIEAHPLKIKCLIFPADNLNVVPLLKELEDPKKKLIIRYEAEDQEWLHVRTFNKHQRIDHPSKPKCPLYDPSLALAPEAQDGDLFLKINKSKKTTPEKKKSPGIPQYAFEEFWEAYPNKLGKKRATKFFNTHIKAPEDLDDIYTALDNYEAHLAKNPWKKTQHGDTFINNYEDWIDFKEPSELKLSEADKKMREAYEKHNK